MKEFNKKEKLILAICLVMTVCCVSVLIGQIRLSSYVSTLISEASATEPQISWFEETTAEQTSFVSQTQQETAADISQTAAASQSGEKYVINTSSKKIHSPDCQYAENMNEENKTEVYIDDLAEYINNGYSICSKCNAGQ